MFLRGALIEYTDNLIPLVLVFEFNPETITFSRSVNHEKKKTQGKNKGAKKKTELSGLGMTSDDMTFSLSFLLDATNRMDDGDPIASALGVQPEIDVIERMTTLQSSQAEGLAKLLSVSKKKGNINHKTLPVIIFVWGLRVLPVQVTSCRITSKAFLPSLMPYRSEATLDMKIKEDHELYGVESVRQLASVGAYYLGMGSRLASMGI